jgi:hypothetical protein
MGATCIKPKFIGSADIPAPSDCGPSTALARNPQCDRFQDRAEGRQSDEIADHVQFLGVGHPGSTSLPPPISNVSPGLDRSLIFPEETCIIRIIQRNHPEVAYGDDDSLGVSAKIW